MKNKSLLKYILLLLVCLQVCCAQETREVSTTATIVSNTGEPIAGASVLISYPQYKTGEYVNDRGITDENGKFSFIGQALENYLVRVEKAGYYEIYYQSEVYQYDHSLQEKQYINNDVTLTLKEIKKPIPMYAISRPEIKVPKYGEKIGFDLSKADWVAPYGKGEMIDVFFEVDGYYNDRKDFDCTLTLSFPKEGDGFVIFNGEERKGSQFISPYEAPLDGYIAKKRWRKMRIPEEKAKQLGEPDRFIGTYPEEGVNFIFRVQTVLDADGNVISAKYAKIYGDIQFFGAKPEEKNSSIVIRSYYFNPTTNDRNLEYAVGQNLFENLKSFEDPKVP